MERGMRQKSRRRNSGEDVKIMIELENELENGPMNVLLIINSCRLLLLRHAVSELGFRPLLFGKSQASACESPDCWVVSPPGQVTIGM